MVDMTKTELQKVADEAYQCFESASRDNGDPFYRIKEGTPEWVTELVHAAHGEDFLPDDWRYEWAMWACEWISEASDPEDSASEFADSRVSVYTGDRLAWLASNAHRPGYCDQVMQDYGSMPDPGDIVSLIGCGQYMEAEEVYSLVLNFLNDRIS